MDVNYIYNLILIFFIFSIGGWMMEVALKYRQYHRFINRGFLIGPYCPIYGFGAVFITVTLDMISVYDSSIGTSFVVSFFLCGLLEYMTSYFLEKMFQARWWDYSQKPMNLYGRVWIGNLLAFGVGGVLIYDVLNPHILEFLSRFSITTMRVLSIIIVLGMASDTVMSYFILGLLKQGVEESEADNSEAIRKEVRYLLANRSVLHKRIIDAYPELTFRTEKVRERLEKSRREREKLMELANHRLSEVYDLLDAKGDSISQNLTSTRNLQKSIIDIQDNLIELLMEKDVDNSELEVLFNQLEEKKEILDNREKTLIPKISTK